MRRISTTISIAGLVGMGLLGGTAQADWTRGYYRNNGTWVAPYQRTLPDQTITNNESFPGHFNPNTGRITPGDPWKALERAWERQHNQGLRGWGREEGLKTEGGTAPLGRGNRWRSHETPGALTT